VAKGDGGCGEARWWQRVVRRHVFVFVLSTISNNKYTVIIITTIVIITTRIVRVRA